MYMKDHRYKYLKENWDRKAILKKISIDVNIYFFTYLKVEK